jgi:hypothetical protein
MNHDWLAENGWNAISSSYPDLSLVSRGGKLGQIFDQLVQQKNIPSSLPPVDYTPDKQLLLLEQNCRQKQVNLLKKRI